MKDRKTLQVTEQRRLSNEYVHGNNTLKVGEKEL